MNFGGKRIFHRSFLKFVVPSKRSFASGHGHHGPHVPEGYDKLGKFCLVVTYLWIFYKLKEDKGQLFGFYKPWLHEHEAEQRYQFVCDGLAGMPTLVDSDEEVAH